MTRVVDVRPAGRAGPLSPLPEQVGKDAAEIAERCSISPPLKAGTGLGLGILAVEPALRPLGACLVDLAGIESLALGGVAHEVIRRSDLLEAALGFLAARVEIRVMSLGEFAVNRTDLVICCGRGKAKDLVWTGHAIAGPPEQAGEAVFTAFPPVTLSLR